MPFGVVFRPTSSLMIIEGLDLLPMEIAPLNFQGLRRLEDVSFSLDFAQPVSDSERLIAEMKIGGQVKIETDDFIVTATITKKERRQPPEGVGHGIDDDEG